MPTTYGRDWRLTGRRLAWSGGLSVLLVVLLWAWASFASSDAANAPWFLGDDVEAVFFIVCALVGAIAVALFFTAIFATSAGTCPACERTLRDLGRGDLEMSCPGCHEFLWGRGGRLSIVPKDHVDDTARFAAPMPKGQVEWPLRADGELACCVCGAPAKLVAIHWRAQRYRYASGSRGSPYVDRTTDVPHCDAHTDGANFTSSVGGRELVYFRSIPFLKKFCRANHVTPS